MRKRLFDLVALLSLVLFVVAAVAWARSHFPESMRILSSGGKLVLFFYEPEFDEWAARLERANRNERVHVSGAELLARVRGGSPPNDFANAPAGWGALGFDVYRPATPGRSREYCIVTVPYVWVVPVLALAPAWWLYDRARGRRRGAAGKCVGCGYDLRAGHERCPECGAAVSPVPEVG